MVQDLRYAVRMLWRNPGFATVAILTLALGIGATTAIFSVVHGVLLRPLPYRNPQQLVLVRTDNPGEPRTASLSAPEVDDLRSATHVIADIAVLNPVDGNLLGSEGLERVPAASGTGNLFSVLGIPIFMGRALDERRDDAGPGPVTAILLSHEIWTLRFGADPNIVGRTVDANNLKVTVAGIVAPGFRLFAGRDAGLAPRIDVWFPSKPTGGRRDRGYRAIARLRQGVSLERARTELSAVAARATAQHPDVYGAAPFHVYVERLQDDAVRESRPALTALMGAVAFVLLIACANLANLLLSRTATRARELAVRSAIGAPRARLLRQLITEGLLLGVLGGTAGLLLATWSEELLAALRPSTVPAVATSATSAMVLTFAIVTTIAASLLFSLAPAIRGTRIDLIDALKSSSRAGGDGRTRLRGVLVAAEVALCVVLLVGAGLMLRTIAQLNRVDPGFSSENVLTLRTSMRPREFATVERKWQFYASALDRVAALPGVRQVSAVAPLPLDGHIMAQVFTVDSAVGGGARDLSASAHTTMPGYFATMGIELTRGREFTRQDIDSRAASVIVDEDFARQAWGTIEASGRRLRRARGAEARWLEVIGVARHVRQAGFRTGGLPQVYLPYHEYPLFDLAVVLKAGGDPLSLAPAIRREVDRLGGRRPVHAIRMMDAYVADATADARFAMILLGVFASLALALSAVGIYGVVAYTTAQRTREIGVRVALGAQPAQIRRLIVGQGLGWAGSGIVAGLAAAALLTRYIDTLLFGVRRSDPITMAAVTLLLAAVAAAACYQPARRALAVDPTAALRAE